MRSLSPAFGALLLALVAVLSCSQLVSASSHRRDSNSDSREYVRPGRQHSPRPDSLPPLLRMQADATGFNVSVALLQLVPSKTMNQTENMLIAEAGIREAAAAGADISLMPELWNTGYDAAFPGYDHADQTATIEWLAAAPIPAESEFIYFFQSLAIELQHAIVVTFLQTNPDPTLPPLNSLMLLDFQGRAVLNYSKVHTCDWTPLEGLTYPGSQFFVAPLEVPNKGNVSIGAMICHDREQPEAARILMVQGAELILVPNACYFDSLRLNQLQTRAMENSCGIAMTNYPAPMYNGYSAAFAGDATSTQLVVSPPDEGIYYAQFDMGALRAQRAMSIWGDAFRRPLLYGPLTTLQKEQSFTRTNFYRNKQF